MNQPSLDDRAVKVTAYITDQTFGYPHWRATQFSAPSQDRYGILLLFNSKAERDAAFESERDSK